MKRKDFSFIPGLTDEDRILLSKIADWSEAASQRYVRHFSFFLNERELDICAKALDSLCCHDRCSWGGYEGAERQLLCVYPQYGEPEEADWPLETVSFFFREEDRLSHRDILGALMSLKIKRECVGDILVGEGRAAAFVRDTVAQDVLGIKKIGRTGVRTVQGNEGMPEIKRELKEIKGTVASLRLDCVAALGLRLSREKTAALIKSGAAEVGHVKTAEPGKLMTEGSVFSVRGYGKFVLQSVDGVSNKERLHITLGKFI